MLWSDEEKILYLIELTICFDTGFDAASDRKRRRYADLAEEAHKQGYSTQILPIQVGSRGVIDDSMESLRDCLNPSHREPGWFS